MPKLKKSEVAKMPNNKMIKVYAGGEFRTVTGRQLKKQMGVADKSKPSDKISKKHGISKSAARCGSVAASLPKSNKKGEK